METQHKKSTFSIINIFKPDYEHWEGVPKINIYILRLMFFLMIVFLGKESWTHILTFKGSWNPEDAMAWCIWGSFSVLAILGIIHPLKMLPIVMLEIFYKVLWLIIVALPLWKSNQLAGSPAEGMTNAFLWVWLAIIAMPWKYFLRKYVFITKRTNNPIAA
jgi:hypothetical protein